MPITEYKKKKIWHQLNSPGCKLCGKPKRNLIQRRTIVVNGKKLDVLKNVNGGACKRCTKKRVEQIKELFGDKS